MRGSEPGYEIISSRAFYLAAFSALCPGLPRLSLDAIYNSLSVLYNFRSVSWWHAVGLFVTSAIYYVSYHGVVEAAKMGIPAGTYFDLLVLTLLSQTVSTFSSYGWYILLLVSA